ncbi:hypothetical protein QQM79_20870 [Marinobacteraceae bacterium S3BR75-40.1]
MTQSAETAQEPQGIGYRLRLILLIAAMTSAIYAFFALMGAPFLENFKRLENRHIYVAVSTWDLPLLVSLPAFLVLIAGLLLRLFDKATDARINLCIKIALPFAFLAILTRVIYGFSISDHMEDEGYSPCWHYSSPAMMSPTVYVRNPAYCVPNAGKVRREVLAWMDELPNNGRNISAKEVQVKVSELLAVWEKQNKEQFPHL